MGSPQKSLLPRQVTWIPKSFVRISILILILFFIYQRIVPLSLISDGTDSSKRLLPQKAKSPPPDDPRYQDPLEYGPSYIPPVDASKVNKALVIGRTRYENVSWVDELGPDWTPYIYTVTTSTPLNSLTVPANVGREAMPYLTFILTHYPNLPKYTFFMHAPATQWHNDEIQPGDTSTLSLLRAFPARNLGKRPYMNLHCPHDPGCTEGVYPFSYNEDSFIQREGRVVWPKDYARLFNVPISQVPQWLAGPCCAQFVVTREAILKRPRAFYAGMREWLTEKGRVEPELNTGWVAEMLWHIMFGEEAHSCPREDVCWCEVHGRCEKEQKEGE
ncbi:MAG: hypothetical protein Q9227_006893 [Pyrenula ochraceoflavens]